MKKALGKILSGSSDKNIRFVELRKLILSFNFEERVRGDHYIYSKNGIREIINIQPLNNGKAKPYQVKQVRNLIIKYKLMQDN